LHVTELDVIDFTELEMLQVWAVTFFFLFPSCSWTRYSADAWHYSFMRWSMT